MKQKNLRVSNLSLFGLPRFSLMALLVLMPASAPAQQWAGIIAPSRATDWSKSGVVGGIPNRTTNCVTAACNTLFGGSVSAASIQAALASAPANTVVRIPAGSFSLTHFNFTQSNVTLRGAGATQTKLTITNSAGGGGFESDPAAIHLMGGDDAVGCGSSCGGPAPASANWTAGYTQGTSVITLANTAGLSVGSLIFLDQVNDSSDGYPAAGDLFLCESAGGCSEEGGNQWSRSGRAQIQPTLITAINGNQVSISPAVQMPNWRASQNPQAWWVSPQVSYSGIEDLTIDFSGGGGHGIVMKDAKNCWLKNLRLLKTNGNGSRVMHVVPFQAAHLTIRDSYFYGPTAAQNIKYAFSPHIAGQFRFENNIMHHNVTAIAANDPVSGGVYAYNYFDDAFYTGGIQPHNTGDVMTLYEGNNLNTFLGDNIHGVHYMGTLFRNHHDGYAHNPSGPIGNCAINLEARSRFFNLIGNVIGHSHFTTYQVNLNANGNAIFCFGGQDTAPVDSHVLRTLMRWGNWDSINNATRFLASEVPSGIGNYANPLPGSQALPASFYLSAQPSWWSTPWGTPKWPAIGPDVTGGNITNVPTGGHADKIPARLCFENTPVDPAYPSSSPRIKLFDGAACYAGGSDAAPGAPTSLRVIP